MVRHMTAHAAFFASVVWVRLDPNEWSQTTFWISFLGLLAHYVFAPPRR